MYGVVSLCGSGFFNGIIFRVGCMIYGSLSKGYENKYRPIIFTCRHTFMYVYIYVYIHTYIHTHMYKYNSPTDMSYGIEGKLARIPDFSEGLVQLV